MIHSGMATADVPSKSMPEWRNPFVRGGLCTSNMLSQRQLVVSRPAIIMATTSRRHPRCRSQEDCIGDPDSPLLVHVQEDGRMGDLYCEPCWQNFLIQKPHLVSRPVKRRRVELTAGGASSSIASSSTASERSPQSPKWQVETDDGWTLWVPLSSNGNPKPFHGTRLEVITHTSANKKQKYETTFMSNLEAVQVNLKTGKRRRVRRIR